MEEICRKKLIFEPRWLLQSELARRSQKNPHYSLRAFATSMGLSHTVLSLAMTGKRPISKNICLKLADALNLSPKETAALLQNRVKSTSVVPPKLPDPEIIDLDTFAVISEWYHFAILSLLELPKSTLDARWIAKQLGITATHARLAVERLRRLGLISECDGRWKQTSKSLKIDSKKSTAATRKFQTQLIQKSIESLENNDLDNRDHTSITFAMDPALIPYARERIRAFRRDLCAELEKAAKPTAVYTIAVQIFPMSKLEQSIH